MGDLDIIKNGQTLHITYYITFYMLYFFGFLEKICASAAKALGSREGQSILYDP